MTQLDVARLRKTYPNGYTALEDVSLSVPEGQFVCIVGRSGAGKSTLLKCLNGTLPITAGHASVAGITLEDIDNTRKRQLQRAVGFVYQEFQLVGRLTALQNVLTGRLGHTSPWRASMMLFTAEDRRIAIESLERVGMLHKAIQRTDSLSGGEKQRVAIGRALAQAPSVLLADEPVANLDPELAEGVLEDLQRAARELGVTTLINIHNVVQARKFADRIVGIAQGRVVFDGTPAEFGPAALDRVYRFDRPADDGQPDDGTAPPSDPDLLDLEISLDTRPAPRRAAAAVGEQREVPAGVGQ